MSKKVLTKESLVGINYIKQQADCADYFEFKRRENSDFWDWYRVDAKTGKSYFREQIPGDRMIFGLNFCQQISDISERNARIVEMR
jgi:hypothetical protein